MSVVMHSVRKVSVKALKRVRRNIGLFEMNIWEPAEEKPEEPGGLDRFSLGTSLSRSTLTDLGSSLTHSEADTAETRSEAFPVEGRSGMCLSQRYSGDSPQQGPLLWEAQGFQNLLVAAALPSLILV